MVERKPYMLIGQAPRRVPGPVPFHKAKLWDWFATIGWAQDAVLKHFHFDVLATEFPGKGKHGDLPPSREHMALHRPNLLRNVAAHKPHLLLTVGTMAAQHVLNRKLKLEEVVGRRFVAQPFSASAHETVIIPLPHPSGASLWLNSTDNCALRDRAMGLVKRELTKTKAHRDV